VRDSCETEAATGGELLSSLLVGDDWRATGARPIVDRRTSLDVAGFGGPAALVRGERGARLFNGRCDGEVAVAAPSANCESSGVPDSPLLSPELRGSPSSNRCRYPFPPL